MSDDIDLGSANEKELREWIDSLPTEDGAYYRLNEDGAKEYYVGNPIRGLMTNVRLMTNMRLMTDFWCRTDAEHLEYLMAKNNEGNNE
tara:strand:- start:236 stop:499 length:264 start_codon:yes stop_codon:yes gene_type:complete